MRHPSGISKRKNISLDFIRVYHKLSRYIIATHFDPFSLNYFQIGIKVRAHLKSMSKAYRRFLTPLPPCHTLSLFALTPLPPCHHQNSDKLWADNKPTFDANFLLSAWKATLKSKWSGAITTLKVILMRLLKRYFEVMKSLFGVTPSPFVTLWHYFAWPPSPLGRWHTFLMAPYWCSKAKLSCLSYGDMILWERWPRSPDNNNVLTNIPMINTYYIVFSNTVHTHQKNLKQ